MMLKKYVLLSCMLCLLSKSVFASGLALKGVITKEFVEARTRCEQLLKIKRCTVTIHIDEKSVAIDCTLRKMEEDIKQCKITLTLYDSKGVQKEKFYSKPIKLPFNSKEKEYKYKNTFYGEGNNCDFSMIDIEKTTFDLIDIEKTALDLISVWNKKEDKEATVVLGVVVAVIGLFLFKGLKG